MGRDLELAELVAVLEDAIGGRGRLFLIAGEPGIGKTWLAEHLATHATKQGTRVLWGSCWEGGGAPPFWPWGQTIRALAEGLDEQTLASWLGAGTAQVAQLVPGLGERLGTATIAAVPSHESDAARFYLFEAVTGLFRRAASVQPLLLVLDDLHAADDPSMLLLQFVARDLRGARVLVVGTFRDGVAERPLGIGEVVAELARAALGFGEPHVEGGLVNRQLVGLLQEALDALGPQDSPLRVRLLARLSLEFTFSDETKVMESLSRQAVAMARRLADPAALRSALGAWWMAVWGPDGLKERTALCEEIVRLARDTGDREMGLGGRDRRAASHAERARLNVTRAIHRAMANLAEANPSLGRHLSSTIRTGRYCAYTPDPRAPIAWER